MIQQVAYWMAAAVGAAVCLGWWAHAGLCLRHWREMRFLRDVPPAGGDRVAVSVIVTARDEIATIDRTVGDLIGQRPPVRELIVVDDGSTDGTAAALARLAARHPALIVLRTDEVPDGWLGKPHAMHLGSAKATGDWLLFCDADVEMAPSAVGRAVAYADREGLGHLTVAPHHHLRGFWDQVTLGFFHVLMLLGKPFWRLRNPRHDTHIGIGAFSMVHRAAYTAIGGHRALAMRIVEDMDLAKTVKAAGYAQDMLLGRDLVSMEWVRGLRGFIRGLEKNAFASAGFAVGRILKGMVQVALAGLLPPVLLVTGDPGLQALGAAAWAAVIVHYALVSRMIGTPVRTVLTMPLGALVFVVTMANSTVQTLRHNGVKWRGRRYSLAALRAGLVDASPPSPAAARE